MKQAPLIRFRIDFGENANVGPGKIELLERIKTSGSLSQAARQMGISYRRAWLLVDSLNQAFDQPATVNQVGGRRGGGAQVTHFGMVLIERYRRAEMRLNELAGECLGEISRHVRHSSPASARRVSVSKKRPKCS